MIDSRWFSVVGLVFDICGAFVLTKAVIVSKHDAVELGVMNLSGNTEEENLTLPAVQDRLKQARFAKIGLALLFVGFALQLIGSWPK